MRLPTTSRLFLSNLESKRILSTHPIKQAILVSNADKLHNLRTIVADYRKIGEELWKRFNPDSDQVWYYSALAAVFTDLGAPLADELLASLEELKRLRVLPESRFGS